MTLRVTFFSISNRNKSLPSMPRSHEATTKR